MKKTISLMLISGFSFFASAQSFDIGLKGGEASTWLLNSNVENGAIEDYKTTFTSEFGLHLELNFVGSTGIEGEIISEKFKQDHQGTFNSYGLISNNPREAYIKGETYTSITSFSELKIPLLFHYQAASGFGFEIGPEFTTISNPAFTINFSGQPPTSYSSYSPNIGGDFSSSSLMGVLGFGWNIKLIPGGKLYLLTDLRLEYGFSDIVGVDAFGQNLGNKTSSSTGAALYGTSGTSLQYYSYSNYASTHTAEVSLNVGLFWRM